jgi:AcrR family transcriptional regulator
MTRTVNEEDYTARRNQILDAAQRLVYTKSYEQMTIQDILDVTGISKGAFYHYFDSKTVMLEALIDRMMVEITKVLNPIVDHPTLSALEKINRYFATTASWKTERKAYLLEIFRVWYTDNNAIMRQKIFTNGIHWMTPMLAKIVRQGIAEGVFDTRYPDEAGAFLISLFQNMGEVFAEALLAPVSDRPPDGGLCKIQTAVAAHTDALERVLGAPAGSLHIMDLETMKFWLE